MYNREGGERKRDFSEESPGCRGTYTANSRPGSSGDAKGFKEKEEEVSKVDVCHTGKEGCSAVTNNSHQCTARVFLHKDL